MAITQDQKKQRQAILEKEAKIISKLNDLADIRERIRSDKELNNQEVDRAEGPQRKTAISIPESDQSL